MWWIYDTDAEDRIVAGTIVVLALILQVLLVRIRVRLRASEVGLLVTGPLRRRQIPWDRIAQISTPRRGRFGRRGASLELEILPEPPDSQGAGPGHDVHDVSRPRPSSPLYGSAMGPLDTELMVFGAFELGTDPAEVGRALLRLRP